TDRVLAGDRKPADLRVEHDVVRIAIAVSVDVDVELGWVVRMRAFAVGVDGELNGVARRADTDILQVHDREVVARLGLIALFDLITRSGEGEDLDAAIAGARVLQIDLRVGGTEID